MFINEVIDRYMGCIMQIFFKNAQVTIYSLADINVGHCVKMTLFERKLGGFFVLKVKEFSYELKTILIRVKSTFNFTFKIR